MTASMPVNVMLLEDFTKLDCNLVPPGFDDNHYMRLMQNSLAKVIDDMGERSAAAQGLKRVITTTEKLRSSPNHLLYLLKDPNGLDGRGEVIGMLKVGRKHLYLFDAQEQTHEVEPLCVLDFFVLPERQRNGHGKMLFEYMLQDLKVDVNELAIDGPSGKMERFLQRNFDIKCLLRQSNNFAVSPLFFIKYSQSASKLKETFEQPRPRYGRHAARKPTSAVGDVIHGGSSCHESNQGGYPYADVEDSESSDKWWQYGVPQGDVSERELQSDAETSASEGEQQAPEVPDALLKPVSEGLLKATKGTEEGSAHAERSPLGQGRPTSLQVVPSEVAAAGLPSTNNSSASREFKNLDLKFYHNRLW